MALVTLALPLAPVVFSAIAPASRLLLPSVIEPLVTLLVKVDVPPTVSTVTPFCVMLPAVLSVTARLPVTVEAPSKVACALTSVALPLEPVVLSAIAPVVAVLLLVSVIVPLVTLSVNVDVPPTVRIVVPLCVMLPVVLSVTARLPPTVEGAEQGRSCVLVTLALPTPVPVVFSAIAPVSRLFAPSVIVALVACVVNDAVPPTVRTPLCT